MTIPVNDLDALYALQTTEEQVWDKAKTSAEQEAKTLTIEGSIHWCLLAAARAKAEKEAWAATLTVIEYEMDLWRSMCELSCPLDQVMKPLANQPALTVEIQAKLFVLDARKKTTRATLECWSKKEIEADAATAARIEETEDKARAYKEWQVEEARKVNEGAYKEQQAEERFCPDCETERRHKKPRKNHTKNSKLKKGSALKKNKTCCCGHVEDEHGRDIEYPGSTACMVEGCGCIAFEKEKT